MTEDIQAAVREAADTVMAAGDPTGHGLDAQIWGQLHEGGFTRLTWPEGYGGGGASRELGASVLFVAGRRAARLPLVETDLQTGWLLGACADPLTTLEVVDGPVVPAVSEALTIERAGGFWRVYGHIPTVAYLSSAHRVIVSNGRRAAVVRADEVRSLRHLPNLAGEDRDECVIDATVDAAEVSDVEAADVVDSLRLCGALGRSILLSGALQATLQEAVRYAGEREQFGRPIGRFQAVQQSLALAAGEVAAAESAVAAATILATASPLIDPATRLAIAAAKSRASEAAGPVASIAHQVHGAIGFTLEHRLRHLTTRLWSWRDEDGSESYWNRIIGQQVLWAGSGDLWPLLSGH